LHAAQKDPICIVGTGSNKIGEAEQNGGYACGRSHNGDNAQ